jgi:hypothetical protein
VPGRIRIRSLGYHSRMREHWKSIQWARAKRPFGEERLRCSHCPREASAEEEGPGGAAPAASELVEL